MTEDVSDARQLARVIVLELLDDVLEPSPNTVPISAATRLGGRMA